MRKPSSPLRRVLAVCLSLLILPWQQPALALAESPASGAVVSGVKLDHPREALDALDLKLAVLLERIKSDDLKAPALTAALPEDLAKLKTEYKAAQDKYIAAEREAPDAAKPELKALSSASTGQLIVEAVVEADLGGVRKDLAGMLVSEVSLSRRPDQIPESDWAAVEKAAPDFNAGLLPLSSRVEKVRNQPPYAVKDVEDAYRPLAAALDASFQNLRGRAPKIDIAGLLAAKPKTASGDAAGALMAEVARALPADKAALLKPQLAAVNTKLAGYLHSGNPADLTSALAEIDRLYDAANIKKIDRADMFERIGSAAQARAQAVVPAAGAAAIQYSVVAKPKGIDATVVPGLAADGVETRPAPAARDLDADARLAMRTAMAAMGHIMPDGDAAQAALGALSEAGVPGSNGFVSAKARELSELLLGRAAALKKEDAGEKGAKALSDAYALIEARVSSAVLDAPDRTLDPAPADGKLLEDYNRRWERNSQNQLKKLKEVEAELTAAVKTGLGVTGPGVWGWSEAVLAGALVTEADAKALAPARARAKKLVDLIKSLRHQHEMKELDLTTPKWGIELRRTILYADGKSDASDLGATGNAVVIQTGKERESLERAAGILARFKAVTLTGDPAADRASLDAFFDKAENKAENLPPMMSDWVRVRDFERGNAKLKAEGKAELPRPPGLPGTDETYRRFIVADRYERIKAISDPTAQQMAELHETYFAMNRAAYIALGCDPGRLAAAEGGSGSAAPDPAAGEADAGAPAEAGKLDPKRRAAFCSGFLANARRPDVYDANGFYAQKKLADQIRPFLNDNDLAKAAANLGKTTAEMQRNLRALSPEMRARYVEKGVDVDAILNQNDSSQVLRWAVVVDQLKTARDAAGWRVYSEVVIRSLYGDKTDLATKVQSGKMRAAAASGDADGLAAALGDVQNPDFLTSGYLAALPRMLGSERSRRSARDRALLFIWNGGVKKGEAPEENTYAGLLLAAAGQYDADAAKPENKDAAAELKRRSALMREVAADPSDPEKAAEALRLAGRPVFDARAVRVGMDTTKVPAEPGTEEEKRDFLTATSLEGLFLSKGESFRTAEGAAKIRSGLLRKIGGELADSQEQNRRDQLIRSASDEHQDRIAKLGLVSGEMLAEAGAAEGAVARRRIEGSASYRELLGVANSVKSYQSADLELYNVTEKLAATAWGRASMTLPGLVASAQAQSQLALRSGASPNGLTLSGWMVGLPGVGDVTRENGHEVPLPNDEKPKGQAVVDGSIKGDVPKNLPKGPLDGFSYTDAKGHQIFTSLNGDYQETSAVKTTPLEYDDGKGRKVKVEAVVMRGTRLDSEGKPAPFDLYRQGKSIFVRAERVRKGADGAEQIYYERVAITAADGVTGVAPVKTTFITMREGDRTVVASVDRDGSGALLRWRAGYDKSEDYIEVDRAGRSQTVRAGSKVMVFSLTEDGSGLAASRNRQTFEVVKGVQVLTKVEYFDLVKKSPTYGRMMVETPMQGDAAGVTVIRAQSLGGTSRLAALTADQRDAIILGKSKERLSADPAATSFRVQADRNGMTPEKLAKFYSNVARLVKNDIGLSAGTGKAADDRLLRDKFAAQFVSLAAFFDGQAMGLGRDATPQGGRVVKAGASSVSFDIGQGGAVTASSSGFDRSTLRVERSNSTQFAFVSLPEKAPHIEHGKPLTGLNPNDKMDKAILDSILSQELAAVRQALGGKDSGFVIFDGGGDKPTTVAGFFGSHNGKEGIHSFSMVDSITAPHDKDNGFAYITSSDLVRRYRVDNKIAGEVLVGGTTAVSNAGEHWGAAANNSIRYSAWGRANPTKAAILGGVVGGVVSAAADWKLLALTVAMGGSNIVAGVLVRTTSAFLINTGKVIQGVARGFDLYFKYKMAEGAYQSVGALHSYAMTGNVDHLNEGVMGLTAAGVGLLAGNKLGKMTEGLGVRLEGKVEGYLKGKGIEVVPKGGAAPNATGGKNEPVKNEPVKNEPVKNEPVKNEPVKNEPVKNEPVRNEPVRNEPVRNEPVKNEPVKTEPNKIEPARAPNGEVPTPRAPTMMGRLAQSLGFGGGTLDSPGAARAAGEIGAPGTKASANNAAAGEAPAAGPKAGPAVEASASVAPKVSSPDTVAKVGAAEGPAAKTPAPESARAETAETAKAGGAEKNAAPREAVSSEFVRPLAPEIAASHGAPEGFPGAAEGIPGQGRPEGLTRGAAKEGAVKEGAELVEPVERTQISKRARAVEREPAASAQVAEPPVRGLESAKGAEPAKITEPVKIVEPAGNVDAALAAKSGASATTADAAPPTGESLALAAAPAAAKPTLFKRFVDYMDADVAKTSSDMAPARQLGRWASGKGEGAMAKLDGVEILGLRAGDVIRAPKLLGLGVERIGLGLDALGTKFSSGMSGLARLAGFEGLASRLAPHFNEYGQRVGVDGHPAHPGFISSMFHDAGGLLQGRFMAAPPGGRPATVEELRYPKLADRPSFREALTAEVLSAGGEVAGRYDPATQKVTFGPKASGAAEVIVEVRPGPGGAVEITGYRVKASDPAVEARAHAEATSLLEGTFRMDRHQASLKDAFASKAARAELARNLDAAGETYLDLEYDAPGGRLSVAGKPGAGDVRVRLRAGEDGALIIGELVSLKDGAKIPHVLRENLNVFAARETVSIAERTGKAARELTPEELGSRLVERLKAERVRVEQEDVVRTALSESRVKDAKARLDDAQGGASASGQPELAGVRRIARRVAELRIEREQFDAEVAAADRHLESLKISGKAVLRAEEALGARERAGRELDRAEAEHAAARAELDSLAEGDAGRPAAQERLRAAQARGREVAERFRVIDENAARAGGELTESAVDALVRRQAANQKLSGIEAAGRVALGELRTAVREARGGKPSSAERRAAVRETLALERLAAAESARAEDGAIREYFLDGLHRLGGGDGRRVVMMRLLAEEGALKGGRSSVGQEAGKNLCVLATAADMAATAVGRPASGAMAEAEAAIIAHHEAKAKAAGAADWKTAGAEAGRAFLRDAAKSGMSGAEMHEMMGAVAEASGLKLVEVAAENIFTKLAQGGQVAIVMTHVADSAAGFNGGSHMVNLSNWRQARNPVTGRVETMVDVADPNIRVLAGRSPGGAPVYEARTVSMPLSEIVPEIRGSLHAESGRVAGYAFEPAGGAGTRGPPARPAAELAARMEGAVGAGRAEAVAGVKAPAGFESRGPGMTLDPNYLPAQVYSKEIMEVAREHGLVYELDAASLGRMKPGVKHNYVIARGPDGTIEMTVGRVATGNRREMGVKHAALGGGREVIFAGEIIVDPATGRAKLDFNSGTYSRVGLDARWAPTPENARALAAHAKAILGSPVEIFNHVSGRPIEAPGSAPSGVGTATDVTRYERYFSPVEMKAAHPAPKTGEVYHNLQHTLKVADMAGEFARARGLGEADARFVSEVALLHDFDAARTPGKPARVLATLESLRADFAGTMSLNGEPGRSVLKERFKWSAAQLKMAEAMIQRTEFPFAEKHPNPAYAEKSPLARYDEMLEAMPAGDRRFVLREAALLSEYADKSSWYATEDFGGAHKAVEGLVNEIGVPAITIGSLGTNGFLRVVGEPESFAHDMALAKKYDVKLTLLNRAEAFKLLPEHYGRTFEANLKGFTEFDAAMKAGDPAAFERARAVAAIAVETAPRRAGVGSSLKPIADSATAMRLRGEQKFARTPDYPNSPVFTENSLKANDFFNRWLNGQEGTLSLRQAMESMHKLYAGQGEIGKGLGGQYMADGAPNNGRAKVTRDFVRDDFGLEANPDGHVPLPGIPKDMSPLFLGSRYFYPDSSIPGMRETYYKALETHLATFSELVNRIDALKARDPNFKSSVEYQALIKASLDTVVDFGRTAAAFRQFKNGNWGLYGPMMNSMVNRLGFSIKNPGYLDIILQGATERSVKPFFEKALREGAEFFPSDGYDPIKGKARAPAGAEPMAAAPAGPRDVHANAPAVVKYEGPIRLRIGGEEGKTLEILSRADLALRFPDVARLIADPRIEHVLIDPANPGQLKGLRRGEAFELGRKTPGRFELTPTVSGKHLRITGEGGVLRIEDLGSTNGTRIETAASPSAKVAGVGAEGGLLSRMFGGRERTAAAPEKIVWPVEAGGPVPARLEFAKLRLDGPLKNLEAVHANVIAVEHGGRKAVLKFDAKPNEARVLAAMAEVALPANVRVPRLLADAPADAMGLFSVTQGAPGAVDYAAVKRAAAEGRHMLVVERLPDDFISMMQVTNGAVKLKAPISRADWQGLLDAVKSFSRRGMGFGDLGNETNIRLRQVPDGKGGVKTEFALIDAGQGTLKGKMETLGSDYVQLKGDRALESRLIDRNLLEGRGALPDPRLAAMARNQVPQSQKFVVELNALMKGGGERPSAAVRAEGHRFTDLAQAAAYLKAPEGMTLLEKTSEGLAGDTVKVEVGGQDWYLKRVSKVLGDSIDAGLRDLTPRERAGNELALREVVRRWFPETFRVAPEAIVIEHGGEIFVLTKGAPAAPAPARLQTMTAAEHADYALLRLVFRAEDLNRGNVLFGKDGKPTLIDFEKVVAKPLDPAVVAREANGEIFLKGFPIVSLKANDPAVYRAHADKLRARFADAEFVAELTGVLERAGWTPERTASYLRALEINLRNFEANLAPYLAEANTVIAKRPQGVGASDSFFDGPPDAVRARQGADKPSPLRQMQVSLEARGQGAVFKEAEAIFYTDGLTGLPNRAFIMEKAEALLAGVKEPTVAMLDMNNFGAVNAGLADVHGPVTGKEMGDGMLADAGPKINLIAKNAGVHVARLGGEEIVVFGAMNDVIEFAAAMRRAFPPEQVLRDAKVGPNGEGIVPGGREHDAISAAMTRMQRTGPMGDFTYGLARTEGRSFDAALKAADGVLNKAKAEGLRGEAVMETPGSGVSFTRLRELSALVHGVPDNGVPATPAARSNRLKAIEELKTKLTDKEYAVFLEAAFKDPLTLTKTAEWVDMASPQWEAAYEGKGSAAMLSARNFKAVNDVLGHAAGDLYLKRLGVIARVEVNRLRKLGYSVEEPVRVGGKEFLLVGKDAAAVAKLVGEKFVAKLNAGQVLPAEQLARLREEAPARGLIPKDRVRHLGDLRLVDEPFKGGFKKTYERLILELESVKVREDQAPAAPKPQGVGAGSDPGGRPGGLASGLRSAAGVHYHGMDVVPAARNPAQLESMKLKRLHLKSEFLTATIDGGRAMIHEAVPIPGLEGFEFIVYRRFQANSERQMTDKLRAKYEFKTVVGPQWTPARIDELGRKLFGHETATNKEVYATLDGVEYVGWIRDGVLTSFGVKRWPGMPDFASRYGPPPPSLKAYLNLAPGDAGQEAAFAAYQASLHAQDMVGALREVRALAAGLSDPAAKTLLGALEAKLAPMAEAQAAQRDRLGIR